MKLTEKVVVFNAQLLGMFIEVKGTKFDGKPMQRRGVITKVEKESLKMMVVQSSDYYDGARTFETELYYKDFFKKDQTEEDRTFYELYIFTEAQKVEVEEDGS